MDPKKLAPFFIITAIIHLVAVASRFEPIAVKITAFASWAPIAILIFQFPLIFIAGFFESRLNYDTNKDFPLWMQIDSTPVKASFTFAFTYLAIVTLQTWQFKLGPINPIPPKGANWDLMTQARFFGMMTVGMLFVNFLATTRLLIPPMRALMSLFRNLPFGLGAGIAALLGLVAGTAAMFAVQSKLVGSIVKTYDAITSNAVYLVATTVGAVIVTIIIGMVIKPKES